MSSKRLALENSTTSVRHCVIVFGSLNMLIYLPDFSVSAVVPGFGPNPFGGPPGHMGPMQPGKNQVDSKSL